MIEWLMSIFGVATALQMVPGICRVWRRKSSSDFSLWGTGLGWVCQLIWLAYAVYAAIPCMIAAGVAWMVVLTVDAILVFAYHDRPPPEDS